MIESMRSWLLACPLLAGDRLNVNYLGDQSLEYALYEAPTQPVLRRYLDGSTQRRAAFALAAVQDYSPDILQNLAASGFWEQLTDWVELQNRRRNFPALGPGKTPRKIEVTSTHYLLRTTPSTARYQVQLALTYEQKGTRR
ncbi:MAG: hypothetical protein ACI4OL_07775 [Gemmiger sp.]